MTTRDEQPILPDDFIVDVVETTAAYWWSLDCYVPKRRTIEEAKAAVRTCGNEGDAIETLVQVLNSNATYC